jgi:hypothetical protein
MNRNDIEDAILALFLLGLFVFGFLLLIQTSLDEMFLSWLSGDDDKHRIIIEFDK